MGVFYYNFIDLDVELKYERKYEEEVDRKDGCVVFGERFDYVVGGFVFEVVLVYDG